MSAQADAVLAHVLAETSHQCCCMGCARMLKESGQGCPICREPVNHVMKHFSGGYSPTTRAVNKTGAVLAFSKVGNFGKKKKD
jgi:predicted amidophosphoribosyltransferase